MRLAPFLRMPARALAAGTLAAACALAFAQDGGQIARQGSPGGAPACVACHGASGQGQAAAGFPRLAGLDAGYLERQLESFAGPARQNPIMSPVAKALTAQERRAVAAYYAGLPVHDEPAAGPAPDATALAAGEALAVHGRWSRGLPACAQCHGPAGLGVGASFPQIAGQPAAYIAGQLHAWQQGTRANDPLGLMHGVALRLAPGDIDSVAAYYASRPAAPPAATAKGRKP